MEKGKTIANLSWRWSFVYRCCYDKVLEKLVRAQFHPGIKKVI